VSSTSLLRILRKLLSTGCRISRSIEKALFELAPELIEELERSCGCETPVVHGFSYLRL